MRRLLPNIILSCLTLGFGLLTSTISKTLIHRPKPAKPEAHMTSVSPSPKPAVTQQPTEDAETVGLSPFDIEYFINSNPQADLSKLWHRLGLPSAKDDSYGMGRLHSCSN